MMNQNAGYRVTVVRAGGEMGFIHGADRIYDSKSYYTNTHHDPIRTNYNNVAIK
jgi:hypothetical protein